MTREEARKILQKLATNSLCVEDYSNDKIKISSRMGAQALRPVSRETVEKVWRGKWHRHYKSGIHAGNGVVCSKCDMWNNRAAHFCPSCGASLAEGDAFCTACGSKVN